MSAAPTIPDVSFLTAIPWALSTGFGRWPTAADADRTAVDSRVGSTTLVSSALPRRSEILSWVDLLFLEQPGDCRLNTARVHRAVFRVQRLLFVL